MSGDSNQPNPFASPDPIAETIPRDGQLWSPEVSQDFFPDAQTLRKQFLAREALLRASGYAAFVVAAAMGLGTVLLAVRLFGSMRGFDPKELALNSLVLAAAGGAPGLLMYWLGTGLRRLRWAARIGLMLVGFAAVLPACGVVIVSGMSGRPALSMMSWLITSAALLGSLVLLPAMGDKPRFIFSQVYQEAIEATPHVRAKPTIFAWGYLALVSGLAMVLYCLVIVAIWLAPI